jgi:hypothetical protein
VNELDEAWELAIAEAERRARDVGRGDVADYLMLRASNDLARRAGVDWLTSVFMSVAGEANRAGASITIEQQIHTYFVRVSAFALSLKISSHPLINKLKSREELRAFDDFHFAVGLDYLEVLCIFRDDGAAKSFSCSGYERVAYDALDFIL